MSRTVRVLALNVLLAVLAMGALRLAFFAVFRNPADAPDAATLLESLYVGCKFDLRLALLLNLPFALLAHLPPLDPFRRPRARRLWVGYFGATSALLLIVYGVDFGHYGYLEARVDASVLRYLFDPRESFGEFDDDRVPVAEHRRMRAPCVLLDDGVVELGHMVAECRDPQRGDRVEVAVAVDVDEFVAFGPFHDDRRVLGVGRHLREPVPHMRRIALDTIFFLHRKESAAIS